MAQAEVDSFNKLSNEELQSLIKRNSDDADKCHNLYKDSKRCSEDLRKQELNHLDRVKKLKVIVRCRLSEELKKKKKVLLRQKRSVKSTTVTDPQKVQKKKSPVRKSKLKFGPIKSVKDVKRTLFPTITSSTVATDSSNTALDLSCKKKSNVHISVNSVHSAEADKTLL